MPLIGRAREQRGPAAVAAGAAWCVLEGEPGIGKSRLLAWLGARASGATVLAARASEYEADLPYALWTEALGEPVEGGDRHGTHRWLRARLEELAAARPLVVCLDDVHWADPASRDALLALIHRPPAGDASCSSSRRAPASFPLERATAVRVGPLSAAEARELVGAGADAVYADSGGNPFYLEQLVRAGGEEAAAASGDGTVPPAVAAALAAELGGLGADARRLLEAAAVVGDPFDVDLAAEVAEMEGGAALSALDDLLLRGLVREGGRSAAVRVPAPGRAARGVRGGAGRAGGSGRTGGRRRRSRGGGRGRSSARTTSSRPPAPATRRRSRC